MAKGHSKNDPMIDPADRRVPGLAPGQTFKSVTAKIRALC
jgi:hypothetical protein